MHTKKNCVRYNFTKHGGIPKKAELKCLQLDHEEADTQTLLHAKYLMNIIISRVIIKSQSFILSLAICKTLPSYQLFFFTGVVIMVSCQIEARLNFLLRR